MLRVTRSTRPQGAQPAPAKRVAPSPPLTPRKRTKPAPSSAAPPASTSATPDPVLALEAQESAAEAEKEGVLLHPALTFSYEDARTHLTAVDPRWEAVMGRLKCKPYEGEQTEAFNPFRSLTTSILGQQVSWLAARSITHKFVRLFYPHLPEKLAPPSSSEPPDSDGTPFPTPAQILAVPTPTATLRSAGLSGRKVEYVLELASRFHDGRLDAKKLWEMEDDEVRKTLLDVRGIGMWTVQMFLMFSMKRPDVLPVGDLGIQKGLCKWYSSDAIDIHSRKLSPLPASTEPPSTPKAKSMAAVDSYPTPSTPSLFVDKAEEEEIVPPPSQFVFPTTSNGLSPSSMKSRLNGKKLKGNIYLTPTEMEELTSEWAPYRSVACWYLWSITDGTGDA